MNLNHKEQHQRNANMNVDVPSAHRLPLEGEWTVCASGGLTNSSEGCERGAVEQESVDEPIIECCQQLCMADGNAGCGVEPADTPNESDTLVIKSITSESPNSGGIPRVHLGSPSWHAGDMNGPGNRADVSRGQADESRGSTDALNMLNNTETAGISCDEGAGAYLLSLAWFMGSQACKWILMTNNGARIFQTYLSRKVQISMKKETVKFLM